MFPALTADDIREALAYAAWAIDEQEKLSTPVSASPRFLEPAAPEPSKDSLPLPSLRPIDHLFPPIRPANGYPTEMEPEQPLALRGESLELYHPSYPDQPTVIVTRHGIYDRRWATDTVAWSDIQAIKRLNGKKNIHVILRRPEAYLSSMPFFQRLRVRIGLALNFQTFYLDTSSLGIRTKDLYFLANRLWLLHRGKFRARKKRRIRTGRKLRLFKTPMLWGNFLPR